MRKPRGVVLADAFLACAGLLVGVLAWPVGEGPNYSLVEPGLYMGGDVAKPPPGTQAVLNLCEKDDPYRCEVCRWEPIPDCEPAPDLDWLRGMVDFVDEQRRAGRTVFVHCRNGVSRSGLVVVAYEMAKNGWTRDEALAFVRAKRPQARPNPAFLDRLLDWGCLHAGHGARFFGEVFLADG
jgi:hypothetical protein